MKSPVNIHLKVLFTTLMLSCIALLSCGGDESPEVISTIQLISGGNQKGPIGAALPQQVIVKLKNSVTDAPLTNSSLAVRVLTGGGSIPTEAYITDSQGQIGIVWTLGSEYENSIEIRFLSGENLRGSTLVVSAISSYEYEVPEAIDGWETSTLNDEGINQTIIEDMVDRIRSGEFERIHDVSIIRNGKLIFDREFSEANLLRPGLAGLTRTNRTHYIASATKSIVSAVTGIAIDQGFIENEQSTMMSFFEDDFPTVLNPDDRKEQITVSDLLTMRAGYQCQDGGAGSGWIQAPNLVGYLLDQPMVNDPGTTFSYCSGSTALVGEIIRKASGKRYEDFAMEYLFSPLGISLTEYHYHNSGIPSLGHGMWLKPTDMAKIGQLFLDNGIWKGERIISERWIQESIKPRLTLSNQSLQYGYYWWSRDFNHNGEPIWIYNAGGNGGQFIFVSQDLDLVVVFTAGNYDHATLQGLPLNIMRSHILPSIEQ